jgi:hypothetical protein
MMAAGEVGLLLTECRANDSAQPSVNDIGARSEITHRAIFLVRLPHWCSRQPAFYIRAKDLGND